MTRWRWLKLAWKTWREKRRIEREVDTMTDVVKPWDAGKTASKAQAAAVPVGVAAAIVAMLRSLLGDKVPWGADQDAWVAGIFMAVLSYAWTYFKDKKKHGGSMTPEEAAVAAVEAKARADNQTALFNEIREAARIIQENKAKEN